MLFSKRDTIRNVLSYVFSEFDYISVICGGGMAALFCGFIKFTLGWWNIIP